MRLRVPATRACEFILFFKYKTATLGFNRRRFLWNDFYCRVFRNTPLVDFMSEKRIEKKFHSVYTYFLLLQYYGDKMMWIIRAEVKDRKYTKLIIVFEWSENVWQFVFRHYNRKNGRTKFHFVTCNMQIYEIYYNNECCLP